MKNYKKYFPVIAGLSAFLLCLIVPLVGFAQAAGTPPKTLDEFGQRAEVQIFGPIIRFFFASIAVFSGWYGFKIMAQEGKRKEAIISFFFTIFAAFLMFNPAPIADLLSFTLLGVGLDVGI